VVTVLDRDQGPIHKCRTGFGGRQGLGSPVVRMVTALVARLLNSAQPPARTNQEQERTVWRWTVRD
jgi:hypothetical protein